MAAITTRQTAGGGATVKGSPLTNGEMDTNLINLNVGQTTAVDITGGTISGLSSFSTNSSATFNTTGFIKIASGTDAERPGSPSAGMIRYNSTTASFEGYSTAWASLGGVKSVDGLTYIIAETSPGDSNDELEFYTATDSTSTAKRGGWNSSRLLINTNVGINTANPPVKLSVLSGNNTNNNSVPLISLSSDRTDRYASIDCVRGAVSSDIGIAFSTANTSGITERMRIDSDGNVGIGTASPSSYGLFAVSGGNIHNQGQNYTASTGSGYWASGASTYATGWLESSGSMVFRTSTTERMRIDSVGNIGIGAIAEAYAKIKVGGTFPSNSAITQIVRINGTIPNTTTSSYNSVLSDIATQADTFTLSSAYHFHASRVALGANSSLTNQMGFIAGAPLTEATNNYGFYSNIPLATGRYNFYANGSAYNYFNGNTSIGALPTSTYKLYVGGTTSTDATTIGVYSSQTVVSGVTNHFAVRTDPYTDTSAAITSIYHYLAGNSSLGSGSTLANQYGFAVGSGFTVATTNIAFYSDLSAASGRWNFYAAGTANNYFAGNVGIGVSPSGTYKLEVGGAFAATTKSFLIDHPTKPGKKLRYGSLEGPENGVYVRGRLTDSNTIELPDYWTGLVDEATITVNLTPIGSHQKLYVKDVSISSITVGNENLLSSAINCFYIVFAERKDVEKLQVEID